PLSPGVRPQALSRRPGCLPPRRARLVSRPRPWRWADLLRRVFAIDALACPNCGGRMRVIATIDDPRVVRRILRHLGLLGVPGPRPGDRGRFEITQHPTPIASRYGPTHGAASSLRLTGVRDPIALRCPAQDPRQRQAPGPDARGRLTLPSLGGEEQTTNVRV